MQIPGLWWLERYAGKFIRHFKYRARHSGFMVDKYSVLEVDIGTEKRYLADLTALNSIITFNSSWASHWRYNLWKCTSWIVLRFYGAFVPRIYVTSTLEEQVEAIVPTCMMTRIRNLDMATDTPITTHTNLSHTLYQYLSLFLYLYHTHSQLLNQYLRLNQNLLTITFITYQSLYQFLTQLRFQSWYQLQRVSVITSLLHIYQWVNFSLYNSVY